MKGHKGDFKSHMLQREGEMSQTTLKYIGLSFLVKVCVTPLFATLAPNRHHLEIKKLRHYFIVLFPWEIGHLQAWSLIVFVQ